MGGEVTTVEMEVRGLDVRKIEEYECEGKIKRNEGRGAGKGGGEWERRRERGDGNKKKGNGDYCGRGYKEIDLQTVGDQSAST